MFGIMLESHLTSERQLLYRHLVDVGMFPEYKMWPNAGVDMVGSESNRIRRAEKQSERRDPTFFALVSAFFFPRQSFTRALNALNKLNKMRKKKTTTTTTTTKHNHKCRVKVSTKVLP